MMNILGIIAIAALGAFLVMRFMRRQAEKQMRAEILFAAVMERFDDARIEPQGPHELPKLMGHYNGHAFQMRPVTDTLATRRLPALWLMVTLHDKLPVEAKFDMMMRPAGPTTFSNFDLLPDTVRLPPGYPESAVVRSDMAAQLFPPDLIKPHLALFMGPRAKELLITNTGVRIVWLLAEGDHARYGVFRQADFGDVQVEWSELRDILETIIDVRKTMIDWHEKKA
jgi:hypothetical protein